MSEIVTAKDVFRQLLISDTPFLDVRAEVEFNRGALPTAFNQPILTTDERHQVGSCYRQQGQGQAVALGHQLVSGDTRQRRIDNWCRFVADNPGAHLHCWRGGMRSSLAQQWMHSAGVDVPLIAGGYKALRHVLLEELDAAAKAPMIIIGGKTGTAKTPFINEFFSGVDLEGIAHHRGSSFGRRIQQPPCQTDFENRLAIALMKKREAGADTALLLEDESRMIGPVSIPLCLWQGMCEAPIAVIEMPMAFRVQRILQEYVIEMSEEHLAADRANGEQNYRDYLLASLERIKKRLGSELYASLRKIMVAAIDRQLQTGDVSSHEAWISQLLERYYDPMYDYQLQKKQSRLVFSGEYNELLEWVGART